MSRKITAAVLAVLAIVLVMPSWKVSAVQDDVPSCRAGLPALSQTLPYVPLENHERKAAHSLLSQAYAEENDKRCRRIAGYVIERFIMNNWELAQFNPPCTKQQECDASGCRWVATCK